MTAEQQPSTTKTSSAEALALYKRRMKKAGFRRMSVWVSDELMQLLASERLSSECGGRTLERLLLGEAAKRPAFPYGSKDDENPGPGRKWRR